MARIVDVSVAWRIRSPQAANGTVRLGVVDEVCEWNDGTWEVSAGRVSRTDSEPQAIADIGTWSQIFYGYLTIDQAIFLGKLTVKDENSLSILRTLWSTASQPMMLDSF